MAYVITDTCIKDLLCVDACPTDCIHPKKDEPAFESATQMYIDPNGCIDCGACVPACTSDSIYPPGRTARRQETVCGEERSVLFQLSTSTRMRSGCRGLVRIGLDSGIFPLLFMNCLQKCAWQLDSRHLLAKAVYDGSRVT